MGDGWGSGTGLDPDSIFYCASLSLYYFIFPALLHRADAGDRRTTLVCTSCQRGQYRYFLFFFRTRNGLACTGRYGIRNRFFPDLKTIYLRAF